MPKRFLVTNIKCLTTDVEIEVGIDASYDEIMQAAAEGVAEYLSYSVIGEDGEEIEE